MRSYIGGALWQSGSRLWVDTPSLRERYTLFKTADSWQFDEREARHGGIEIVSYPRPFPHPPPYVRNPAVGSVSGTLARFH